MIRLKGKSKEGEQWHEAAIVDRGLVAIVRGGRSGCGGLGVVTGVFTAVLSMGFQPSGLL